MVYLARDGPQDMAYACTRSNVLAIMPPDSQLRSLIDHPEARAMISSLKRCHTLNAYNDEELANVVVANVAVWVCAHARSLLHQGPISSL